MSAVRMSVKSGRRWIAAVGVVTVWLVASPPQAGADCTGAGDFGAGSGCAPPGGGSSSAKAWPPTSVDWPPNVDSDSSGKGGDDGADTQPIVLPDGQKPSTMTSHTSAPATPTTSSTPIVPVGSP